MPKGVPWSKEETDRLIDLRKEGKTASEIAFRMGKSDQAVVKKLERLGLRVVQLKKSGQTTTSELILPKELPCVEEVLKLLGGALKALQAPGLSRDEVLRLKTIVLTAKIYQERLAEYIDYRGLERELVTQREEIDAILEREREEEREVQKNAEAKARMQAKLASEPAETVVKN